MAPDETMTYEQMFRHTQAAYGRLELRLGEIKRERNEYRAALERVEAHGSGVAVTIARGALAAASSRNEAS